MTPSKRMEDLDDPERAVIDGICAEVTRFSRDLERRLLENADRKGLSWRELSWHELIVKFYQEYTELIEALKDKDHHTGSELQRDILDVAALCLMFNDRVVADYVVQIEMADRNRRFA